ncbi:amidohydrolase family protein [Streptomyces sp. Je 1-369]|uniref:amidohydrolase family protein n=1 Tax=Streptomyces sp. Je 1-369 TaxID=2966192 RepID=UPI002286314B|nr:amidohydrolase family protein [Streptomyces sp. Je 1-369]WAL93712.1 amidohydrolase family protein [Streptomyces sp. Je 1-369]
MIIDAHVHAGEYYRHYSARFAEQMTATTDLAPEDLTAPEDKLLAEMDAAGVDRVFLLAFDVRRVEGFSVPNEFVADLCARHPDRLTGFASVDAGTPGAAERLREAVTGLGLRGLKTAPCYLRMSPADRRWYDVYETAADLDIPVLIHTGYTPSRQADPRFFSPLLVEQVAKDFPGLKVILAHLGTPWTGPCVELLARHANLYADLSIFGSYQPPAIVAKALAHARGSGVLDRLLWGTDFPFASMTGSVARTAELARDPGPWPAGSDPLSPREYEALMGGTAARLLASTAPHAAPAPRPTRPNRRFEVS